MAMCAVGRDQDHDGLLELDDVEASKAVATSSRAVTDTHSSAVVSRCLTVPDLKRVIIRDEDSSPSMSLCVPLWTPWIWRHLIWTYGMEESSQGRSPLNDLPPFGRHSISEIAAWLSEWTPDIEPGTCWEFVLDNAPEVAGGRRQKSRKSRGNFKG